MSIAVHTRGQNTASARLVWNVPICSGTFEVFCRLCLSVLLTVFECSIDCVWLFYWLCMSVLLTVFDCSIDYVWVFYWLCLSVLLTVYECSIDRVWLFYWLCMSVLLTVFDCSIDCARVFYWLFKCSIDCVWLFYWLCLTVLLTVCRCLIWFYGSPCSPLLRWAWAYRCTAGASSPPRSATGFWASTTSIESSTSTRNNPVSGTSHTLQLCVCVGVSLSLPVFVLSLFLPVCVWERESERVICPLMDDWRVSTYDKFGIYFAFFI